jgi:hypothetical protein
VNGFFNQVVNVVFGFEFWIEPERKLALLRSNQPGISSPYEISLKAGAFNCKYFLSPRVNSKRKPLQHILIKQLLIQK